MITSSLVSTAATVPALAAKPLWKTTTDSTCLNCGEPALELHVHFHGSRDGADRARADAELLDRFERRLLQLRMRRQAEIVVRRQVDDRLVIEGACAIRACLRGRAACDTDLAASATRVRCRETRGDRFAYQLSQMRIVVSVRRMRFDARVRRRAPSASSQPYQHRRCSRTRFGCTTTCVEPESFNDCHAASGSCAMRLQPRDALLVVAAGSCRCSRW